MEARGLSASAGGSPDPADPDRILALCEATLSRNWRQGRRRADGKPFAYTRPSPGHYPWQWYWDSCFAAIAWRHFDPARSRAELESLLSAEREDGFIGHTIFWDTPVPRARRIAYNITSPQAEMTSSIQPPMLAWAWRIAVGDPAEVPGIVRHHAWIAEHRDLDRDGLVWIVQPDESGLDDSTQFDAIWGRRAHSCPGFILLVRRNRRLGFDLRRVAASGGPVCCEVLTNVLHNLSRLALGQPSLTPLIVERMYDERAGAFMPLARPAPRRRPALTCAALSPLALPDLPEEIGRRLVEEHVLNPRRFLTPVAPPSVAISDPSFSLVDHTRVGTNLYWRGPTWVNAAWLVWMGMLRLGYTEAAGELVRGLAGAIATHRLREYYHPLTGEGMGAVEFAWSALIADMLIPDARAAASYL